MACSVIGTPQNTNLRPGATTLDEIHIENAKSAEEEMGILRHGGGGGRGSNGPNANEYEYEEVLERIGFGKTQWLLLLISGLLTLTSLAAQTSLVIISVAAQCEFKMSQVDKVSMISACVTGIFLSTYFWGYVSDAIGRRTVLLYGTFVSVALEFVTMFVTHLTVFNILNLLMGISLGGVMAALYAYLAEYNTAKYRAVVINYSTMFASIAVIYVSATAWPVLSADWSIKVFEGFVFRPWRLIILLSLLPGLIGALLLLPFPESPKLLLAQQKQREAHDAVNWICKFNTGRTVASVMERIDFVLKPEMLGEESVLANRSFIRRVIVNFWRATVPLVYNPHGLHFILSSVAVFGMFFSSSGMKIWFPEIVNRSSGEAAVNSSTVCEILDASFATMDASSVHYDVEICDNRISTKTYIDNIRVGCAFLVGFIVQGVLLNPLGRKNVLLIALSIATISGILLHFVTNATFVLILLCLYIMMPVLSISVICGALVDLVPTQLRGKAVSVAFTLGRLGIIVATNLIGVMLAPLCNTTLAIFTASLMVCVVLVSFLPV